MRSWAHDFMEVVERDDMTSAWLDIELAQRLPGSRWRTSYNPTGQDAVPAERGMTNPPTRAVSGVVQKTPLVLRGFVESIDDNPGGVTI